MAVGERAKVEDFTYVFLFPWKIAINWNFFEKIAFCIIFGLYKTIRMERAHFTILGLLL